MKRLFAALFGLLMAASLVACGNGNPAASTSGSDSADAPEMESDLVVYSTATEEQLSSWSERFRELYPDVNIEFVSGGAGELITRVTGEAAAPNGDVFMAGLLNTDGDAYSDLFEHYLTPL